MAHLSEDLLIPGLLASPLPHAILGMGHDLRWVNPAWQRLCLREATEGESWFDQVDEAALQIELPHITQLIAGTISSYTCASSLRTPDGPVAVMLHAVRINADITLVGAVPASLPVALPSIAMVPGSGRTPADDQVLASVMSHDFHQHLRLITSYISLIEQQEQASLEPRLRSHLQTVSHHAGCLRSLITDLVQWLRLDSEVMEQVPCDLADVWRTAQQREIHEILQLQAIVTHDPDLPLVTGDRKRLIDLFWQVLRNALQYHGPGCPRVHLAARSEGSQWCVTVTDDGAGLGDADCRRAMGLFKRLHTFKHVRGNGMGLPLAQRIAVRHGGRLDLLPSEGQGGCTVQVYLPV